MALDLAIQKTRLRDLLQSMYEEGIIDDRFCQLQAFKESMGPDFVVRSVTSYCVFVRNLFIDLTNHMSQVNINFYAVTIAAHDLSERTDSIGAVHVKLACAELLRASEANSPEELYIGPKARSQTCKENFRHLCRLRGRLLSLKADFEITFDAFLKENFISPQWIILAQLSLSIGLLQEYVQSLLDEGIVNDQFASVQTLKSADEPDAIVRLITSYFADVEAILSELTRSIDSPEADFDQLAAQANTIKEKSLCIGAEHMKLASDNLTRACEEKQGRKFSQALNWMKLEFTQTQDKLDAVVQMEKRILRLENKRPK